MGFTVEDNVLKSYEGRDYALSLPDHITEIGSWAFEHRKLLKTVQMGTRVVKIGRSAFSRCKALETIEIPESVTDIGDNCFYECTALKHVAIPNGITHLGECCFYGCTSLEKIVIPEGVTRIEESTFRGCSSLSEVTLPSTIEYIGRTAFKGCQNLVSIHLKKLPTVIEGDAFRGCSRLYEDTGMVIIGQTIYGYSGKDGVLKIPSTVTAIAIGAFWGNIDLVEIEIPGSIEVIPDRAFMGCTNLKKVILNDGLREICQDAFEDCWSIKEITIPESVTSIGTGAFQFCKNLRRIKLPLTLTSIGASMFSGCIALEDIELPCSVKEIMEYAFSDTGIRELDLSNIVSIDMNAFSGSKIERIILGENFRTIYPHMPDQCYALQYLYITDSAVEIADWYLVYEEQVSIPFIHVSPKLTKLIKEMSSENKLNAVYTFLQTRDSYSEDSQKRWLSYIKRCKVHLLKWCINGERKELYRAILDMVSLTEANVAEIKEYIKETVVEDAERYYADRLIPIASAVRKPARKTSGSVVAQLIKAIPKSSTAVRKVYLLEAATLFGSYEELQSVIEKYQSFEYTKGAVLIAFQTRQLKKMSVLLGLNRGFSSDDSALVKRKYRCYNDFAAMITERSDADLHHIKAIKEFIDNTIGAQNVSIEITYGTDEKKNLLREILTHLKVADRSRLLHQAIMRRNFSVAQDLLELGCAIDFGRLPEDTGHCLSRMIPGLDAEKALLVLRQYTAPKGVGKIKLDESAIYSNRTLFSNPEIFAAVCSGYNINRFAKKKLLEFAVSLPDTENLQYLITNGYVKVTRPLILSAIESAKTNGNPVTEQWLVKLFKEKYGNVEIGSEKARPLTQLERIKKDWTYAVVNGEVYIKGYKGTDYLVVVPSVIAGKPVTKIYDDAFSPEAPWTRDEVKRHRNSVEEITLPTGFTGFYTEGVRYDNPKFGISFKHFVVPDSSCNYSYTLLWQLLDIADVKNVAKAGEFIESEGVVYSKDGSVVIGVRRSRRISKYVMPAGVKFIVHGLWGEFTDLEELTITSRIRVYGSENAYERLGCRFGNMKKLKRVTVSGMDVFPGDLLSLADTVEEIVIHEGIQKIEKLAFRTCNSLRKLTIPRSCTEIGDNILPPMCDNRYVRGEYKGDSEKFMLYCYEGSYAEQYANEEKVAYTYLKESDLKKEWQ